MTLIGAATVLRKFYESEDDSEEIILDALEAGYDGDYEESLEILDEGTYPLSDKLDYSTKVRIWELKAYAFVKLNRHDEALEAIENAIKFDEKNPVLFLEKAEILYDLENYSEALSTINEAISKSRKEGKDEFLHYKADYLSGLNKHKEALECFNKYLKKNPDSAYSLLGKSRELFVLGEGKDSLKAVEAALKLEPKDIDLLSHKGMVLLYQNNFEESLDCFEKCLERDSSDELSWFNKACILSLLDKKEDALDAITVAISLDEENITRAKEEQDLDNIRDTKQFIRLVSRVI